MFHANANSSNMSAWPYSTPGDRHRNLAFLYSEYFCAADRTNTPGCWSAVLEGNPHWVLYLHLFPALHAISCRHHTLLLILLHIYCYYKNKALSIPFGSFKANIVKYFVPAELVMVTRVPQKVDSEGESYWSISFLTQFPNLQRTSNLKV